VSGGNAQRCADLFLENEVLRAALLMAQTEAEQLREQYQNFEEQNSNLANLYVASHQLHTCPDRATVLSTIQEIIINLIGSEQLVIYQRGSDAVFRPAASFGLDEERLVELPGEGALEKLGQGDVFADPAHQQPLTACVPLKVGDRVEGAILVFRLLEHKPSLEQVDHELFELLSVHASTALHCASLHPAPEER
jgi:nitrate/nitrite-specific signal transduction histidine kinase